MSLEQALVDFGREIGIPTLSPAPHGGVQLRFDSGATLGAARQGEHVVVHLAAETGTSRACRSTTAPT